MKIRDPLLVTVTEELRAWATRKWGEPYLPDVFITEFHNHFSAQHKLFTDATRALQNWVHAESPAGIKHRPWVWEKALAKAKTINVSRRLARQPEYTPRGYVMSRNERSAVDVARAAIAKLRMQAAK